MEMQSFQGRLNVQAKSRKSKLKRSKRCAGRDTRAFVEEAIEMHVFL